MKYYDEDQPQSDPNANEIIRVRSNTDPTLLAGAVAKRIRLTGTAHLRAIGAAAISQAVKGITIANDYLAEEGTPIAYTSSFQDLMISGEERTALNFMVFQLAE